MNRRDVVFMLGGAAVGWPLTTGAQQQKPMPVIGFLGGKRLDPREVRNSGRPLGSNHETRIGRRTSVDRRIII